jgi:hypothetical protein
MDRTNISLMEDACFLCLPSPELAFLESQNFYALAGLGPIVDGYWLLYHRGESARKINGRRPTGDDPRKELVFSAREKQAHCDVRKLPYNRAWSDDGMYDEHDHHCFHAHLLAFPGANDVSAFADSYFAASQAFSKLDDALAHGAQCDEYLLVSPSTNSFTIFSTPLNVPRQLARYLVAWNTGNAHLADWRAWPQRDRAIAIAEGLRSALSLENNVD